MIFACPHCHARTDRRAGTCQTCKKTMTRRCPFCAEDVSVLATVCKYCGENVPPLQARAPVAPAVARREEPVEILEVAVKPVEAPKEVEFVGNVKSVAWEDRSKGGWISRAWKTWGGSQFNPAMFWRLTPPDTGHFRAISYSWALRTQILVGFGLVILLGNLAMQQPVHRMAFQLIAGLGGLALLVPALFVLTALETWLRAALWHLPLKLLGAKGGYQATVRTVGYNSGAQVWLLLPVAGLVPAIILGFATDLCALREVHKLPGIRAFAGAALPLMTKGALVLVALALVCA